MTKKNLAIAALVGMSVAGCAIGQSAGGGSTQTMRLLAKTVPTGNPEPCAESSGHRCVVTVAVTPDAGGGCATVSVPEYLGLLDDQKHKSVEWVLPNGYLFCPRGGDGVFYSDINVGDPVELDANGRCAQTVQWKRKRQDNDKYAYTVRFRNSAGTARCELDPWLRN